MDTFDTWHYTSRKVTIKDLEHPDELNELGDMGWELIALERLEGAQLKWLAVFKKLLQN
jgi:hypothetical protein